MRESVTLLDCLDCRPLRSVAMPKFDTLALHAGYAPDPTTGARAVPLYMSTSFVFDDADHAAALFNMERSGHVYSRISNPTVAVFEERMAALDGDRKSTRLNSSHIPLSRMPSSA